MYFLLLLLLILSLLFLLLTEVCTFENKFYRGFCGGGKSAPIFKNPNGNANGNANGMGVLTAMTLTNNNGNQVATWTRPLANSYAGAEDIRSVSQTQGRYLNQETYFEPNKEYMIYVAGSGAGRGLDQEHQGAPSMSSPMFTGSAPPLQKPTCAVYIPLWGGCPVDTEFTGEPMAPAPAECNDQNDCNKYECCELKPPPTVSPTPEVTNTPTPSPTPGVGPDPLPPVTVVAMARCPTTYRCKNTGWERLVDHGDNFCSGTGIADCSDADCCTCMTKKANICASWRMKNQMETQADRDNSSAFGISPSLITVVFAMVGVFVMVF
jgi:hypothetical protein